MSGSWRAPLFATVLALHPIAAVAQHAIAPQGNGERVTLAAADSAYAAGNAARAERAYRAVLQADPTSSRAAYQLAQLTGDRDERVRLLRRYVALEPRDAWGHIALGDALARVGDTRGGLAAYDSAERLAPGARDVHIGRTRVLARAQRTDDAIAGYERWTSGHPNDAEAWRELAAQRARAGRSRAALAALRQARAVAPEARPDRRIDDLQTGIAPWLEVTGAGSHDSDGNSTGRASVSMGAEPADAIGVRVQAAATRVSDGVLFATVRDAAVGASWRPKAALRLDARAGVALPDVSAQTVNGTATGELRIAWRQPGTANSVNARAGRTLASASPLLLRNGVVRDEVAARADREVTGPLRLRGLARVARITATGETNGRTLVGGGIALGGTVGEISATVQQIDFAHPSSSGYFAPRSARLAELGAYSEMETANGLRVALDVGVGAQQASPWAVSERPRGAPPFQSPAPDDSWSAAYRAWTELAFPLAPGRELRLEVEAYDARIGSELAPNGQWRFGSAALTLRWALR